MTVDVQPQQIRHSQLRHILENLGEGVILLDPDGTITWANQVALDIHDCDSINELGANATIYAERFHFCNDQGEPLPMAQSPLSRLCKGETFADLLLTRTPTGPDQSPRTLSLRGLVISGENNQPEVLVLFMVDTTEKVSSDELFDRFFSRKPAPAAILRLDDSRYVRVNDGFCKMTGFARKELVGRPFHEIDVLHDAQWREEALHALATHEVIRQQESRVRTRDGDAKAVIVAGQPLVIESRPCMLFTFIDLELRKRAEQALRESEERFATAFRMAPVPMIVCVQSNWCVIEANGAFITAVGRPRSEIIGRTATQVGLHLSHRALRDIGVALESSQLIQGRDAQLRTPDGGEIDGLLSADSVMIQNEACALFVIQDITERKRTETELISAMEAVMKDASWFSRTVMEKLAQVRRPHAPASEVDTLTGREREVLEWICNGHGDARIAEALGLSRNTVRNHVATLYSKIGVNRRSAAVIWGRERGFGTE